MKRRFAYIAVMIALAASGSAQAKFCGDIRNQYGPFDYRKAATLPEELSVVERNHFTTSVEQNIKGSTGSVGSDIDYTLRAWPNHHRALAAMSRQGLVEKTPMVRGAKYPVECYFLRAFEFAPDDGVAHAVFATHLSANGREKEALAQFKRAVELEPDNPALNYNAGLASLKTKDYDNALLYAQKAYSLNFPLPGLKSKLVALGKWKDLPAAAPVQSVAEPERQAEKSSNAP
jgi:tetratricopeptide (TPR) repeat protein